MSKRERVCVCLGLCACLCVKECVYVCVPSMNAFVSERGIVRVCVKEYYYNCVYVCMSERSKKCV